MINYKKLKDRPRDFLAVTGLTLEEFLKLLPAFQAAYDKYYPPELTRNWLRVLGTTERSQVDQGIGH